MRSNPVRPPIAEVRPQDAALRRNSRLIGLYSSACSCPAALTGAALAAFGAQQPADVLGEFAGDVEHGTIRNQGEYVLAIVGGALVARATLAFLVEPLGEVDEGTKYAMNAVILLGAIALLTGAATGVRRAERGVIAC